MSERGIISQEKAQQCDFCGKIEELRPYGPKGEKICFQCGMADEQTTRRMAFKYLFGKPDLAELENPDD